MKIKPLRNDLKAILRKNHLENQFHKQKSLFEKDSRHPSLHTEKLEPRKLNVYSLRITKKWRVVFIILPNGDAEIVDINSHYQ